MLEHPPPPPFPSPLSGREFVSSFIQFPKPLIAAVNGPAVGISVTLLGLCDLVYAADNVSVLSCNQQASSTHERDHPICFTHPFLTPLLLFLLLLLQATFHTPFMRLGQSPEACSSLLFPQIMSPARVSNTLTIFPPPTPPPFLALLPLPPSLSPATCKYQSFLIGKRDASGRPQANSC